MRKFILKKSLSLLMAVVMLFSSSVAYLPVFANAGPTTYTIVEGEQIANDLKSDHSGTDLLIEGELNEVYSIGYDYQWKWYFGGGWQKFAKNIELDPSYERSASPIFGTSDLPVGSYQILIVNEVNGELEIQGTVTLNVVANTAPTSVNGSEAYNEVSILTRNTIDLSSVVADLEGPAPIIKSVVLDDLNAGTVSFDGLNVLYDQAAGYSGIFKITYVLEDGLKHNLLSMPYEITVTVTDTMNTLPEAIDVFESTDMNTEIMIDLNGIIADPDAVGFVLLNYGNLAPEEGLVSHVDNTLKFMPAAGFTGTVSIVYTIQENESSTSSSAIVTIYVTASGAGNTTMLDERTTPEDTAIIVDVLNNDTIIVGVSKVEVSMINTGTAVITGDNKVHYTPNPAFVGDVIIVYAITDRLGRLVNGTLEIEVTEVLNGALQAHNDVLYVDERSGLFPTRESVRILDNDIFEDGLTNVRIINDPLHGRLRSRRGNYSYYPDLNYSGADFFVYEITDSKGATSRATVSIEVLEKNREFFDPEWRANRFYLDEGETINEYLFINWIGFIDEIESVEIVEAPAYGQVQIGTDGLMTYTAHPTFNGTDWLRYRLVYRSGNEATKYAKFIIGPTDTSLLVNDLAIVDEDSTDNMIQIQLNDLVDENIVDAGLLAINKDPMIPEPIRAELVLSGNDYYILYSPGENFNGRDVLSYFVEDEDGFVHEAIVEITVLPLVDLYNIDLDATEVLQGRSIMFNTLTDIAAEFMYVKDVLITPPLFGTVLAGVDGNISYTPGNQHAGPVTIAYTYTNEFGDIASGSIIVNVFINNDRVIVDLGETHEEYFLQQFSTDGLYLLDGITWISQDNAEVVEKWVGIHKVHGLIADDFTSGTIDQGIAVNSYGEFYLSYFGQDENQNVGQAFGYRKLRINFQPILSLEAIELDENHKPVASVDVTSLVEYDYELFFGENGFDSTLFAELYLFDHEDYPVEGSEAPFVIADALAEMPAGLTIKFVVGDVEITDPMNQGFELTNSNLWQQLIVPFNMTEKVFELSFFALDSDGGVSELTDVYSVKVKNNPPTFIEDNMAVASEYLYMPTLYTTINTPINLWSGVEWYDLEAEWFAPDPAWAVTTWFTFRKVDEGTLVGAGFVNESEFEYLAGLYELKYYVQDANGEFATARRFVEINTNPEISSLINPLIFQVGQVIYDIKDGIVIIDADLPADDLEDSYEVEQYYDFEAARLGEGLDNNNWVDTDMMFSTDNKGLFNVLYTVSDDPWSTIHNAVDGEGNGSDTVSRMVWVNEAPVLTLEEELVVILKDEAFDPMAFISATDFEDDYLNIDLNIQHSTGVMVNVIEEEEAYDTSVAGIYYITYTVEDSMGGSHEVVLTLYIVEPTTLDLSPEMVEMDLGGYFPTFYGVDVSFWNENQVIPVEQENSEGDIKRTLVAMIGDDLIDEFVQFEDYDTYVITYTATLWVFMDETWMKISEVVKTRTVKVLEEAFEDYIYTLDAGMDYMIRGRSMDELPTIESSAVLVKINPEDENDMRFVSAIMLDGEEVEVIDVAETKDGKVYLLIEDEIYLYNAETGDLSYVYELDGQSLSLAANEDGHLVVVYNNPMRPTDIEFENVFEISIIDPNAVEFVDNSGGMVVMSYLFEAPLDIITDLAYNDDFTKIYVVGYTMEEESNFMLIELIPYEEEEVEPDFMELDFMVGDTYDLGYMFWQDGIAVLGQDIYITKSNSYYMMQEVSPEIGDTFIDHYTHGLDGFVFVDSITVEEFTTRYVGAGSTFDTLFELTPANKSIYVGFARSSAEGIANFALSIFPEVAFETASWDIVSGNTFITNNGNGEFEAIAANITGSHTATIKVSAVLKATGEIFTKEATIFIYRSFQPVVVQEAPAPVIGVSLDIDAITLDYGETADPDFISYDFTETVTGTANTAVTWSLDDDTFVTVDENGVVTAREDVPVDTGDVTVELTVRTVIGNATATATIIFEEQAPLGAIEFFQPYITGYPNGEFAPDNFVSRAEVATMFGKFLNLESTLNEQVFSDVSPEHWAYEYVQAMYEANIFTGYKDEDNNLYFDADAPIKRSEIAQVFTNYWAYLGISVAGQSAVEIPDVGESYWAYEAINRVFNTGLFAGFEDGSFKPEDPTLRVQLVTMINKLLERPQLESETSSFSDVLTNHPFFGDIEAASQTFLKPQGE